MKYFFQALLGLIAVAAVLPYLPILPPYRVLWIAELLVTELAPYLFIFLCLTFLVARHLPTRLTAGLVAILSFIPVLIAASQERNWVWNLEYGRGSVQLPDPSRRSPYFGDLENPLFRWKDFFKPTPSPIPEALSYRASDGSELPLYRYPSQNPAPVGGRPWVLLVHGGGWDSGQPNQLEEINFHLNEAGFDVFAPAYRLAPKYRWPTQAEDIRAAIASIQSRAGAFRIDARQFFLFGRSAGGQIALKVAYATNRPEGLRGVIAFYAPTDLDFAYRWTLPADVLNSRLLMEQLTSGTPDSIPTVYRDASPINDVSFDDPPTLLLYGRPDPLVWYRHGERLMVRLRSVGVPVVHIELPWGVHGFDYFSTSLGGQISRSAVLKFLKQTQVPSDTTR
jgi:acetyl esterase/lipase